MGQWVHSQCVQLHVAEVILKLQLRLPWYGGVRWQAWIQRVHMHRWVVQLLLQLLLRREYLLRSGPIRMRNGILVLLRNWLCGRLGCHWRAGWGMVQGTKCRTQRRSSHIVAQSLQNCRQWRTRINEQLFHEMSPGFRQSETEKDFVGVTNIYVSIENNPDCGTFHVVRHCADLKSLFVYRFCLFTTYAHFRLINSFRPGDMYIWRIGELGNHRLYNGLRPA